MTERTQRRLVTGTNEQGEQVFVSDKQVAPFHLEGSHPESVMWGIWGKDHPSLPDRGTSYDYRVAVPPPGGFRLEVFSIPPESETAQFERPNMGAFLHQTATIDVGVVIQGEVLLELGNGETRLLRAGDSFVNHGTSHIWHNRSDQICLMAVAMIGAEYEEGPQWWKP